jgi:hypothetical protein
MARRPRAGYGEAKQLREQKQAAPLAGQRGVEPSATPPQQAPQRQGLFEPTSRPEEPMTSGVPMGPGDDGPMIPELDLIDYSPSDLVVRALMETPGLEHLHGRLMRLLEG